ncbi:MAG: DeoR/GlpR family DNA-binding transcription regulator [Propionibacteriaceae bacterium]|nr:DeoR/GlpR family DNA-binding transcription regulator [Propionibacteriaceae bacterium]
MLATERQSRLLELLAASRFASTDDLATELGASIETIRRDIRVLDQRQALHRIRGGAVATPSVVDEALFNDRRLMHVDEKMTIANLAAGLLSTGQTVFLDLGTTAVQVARAMAMSFSGTVATTSLQVADVLARCPAIDVLVCGGRVRGGDLGCWGAQAVDFFKDVHADVAFIGSGGLDFQSGLTDFHLDEVPTKRQMIASARCAYVLADSSKFGVTAPYAVCALDQIDGVIAEVSPPTELQEALTRGGAHIIF